MPPVNRQSSPVNRLTMLNKSLQLYKDSLSGLSKEIWLLTLIMFINRTGSMVLPFATLYLTTELGFTLTQAGIVIGFFGFGSLVGQYIGGKLSDTIGTYWTQVFSLFSSGISFFFLMQAETYTAICTTYFITALLIDIFRPANMAAVGIYSKPENRTRSLSLIRLAINLGYGTGTFLGGLLAVSVGYYSLFLIDGATCIFAGILFMALIPKKEKIQAPEAPTANTGNGGSPFKDKRFLLFSFFLFLMVITFLQLIFAFPPYLKTVHGLNEDFSGLMLSVNCIFIVIIEMPLIYYLENLKETKLKWSAIGLLCIALGHLCFLLNLPIMVMITGYIFFISIGEIVAFPFTNTWVMDRSTQANRGQYMAVYGMIWSVGFIVGPSFGLRIVDLVNYDFLWLLTGILGLIGATGFWVMRRKELGHLSKSFNEQKILDEVGV